MFCFWYLLGQGPPVVRQKQASSTLHLKINKMTHQQGAVLLYHILSIKAKYSLLFSHSGADRITYSRAEVAADVTLFPSGR